LKPGWRAADRGAELLAAARGWLAAGLIDETTFGSIAAEGPPTGPRLGRTWRILVFTCVVIGVSTSTAVAFLSFGLHEATEVGCTFLLSGLALAAVTEVVVDRCSFQPTGAEAATSLLAAVYLCAAAFTLLDDLHLSWPETLRLACPWCAAVFALAAWRWGFRLYGGAATVFILLLAAQFPCARLAWVAAAALLAAWATVAVRARDLAPSHRGSLELVRIVSLAAIYAAVNYYSVEKGLIEEIGRAVGAPRHRADNDGLLLAGIGSALYPLGLFVGGLRSRDRALIDLGIVAAGLSLATAFLYLHPGPLWLVLAASGAVLAGTSLLLERWLRSGRDGERAGFTAATLDDEGRQERLLAAAAGLATAPEARSQTDEPPGIAGKGGSFGGAGADGTF
jgi:hypothetical protein